ncbi:MAG: 16S rRNA (cytidine(1402)-2'-O)-methyltransferase [Synergistaceae bacterium]|jgi:16S rRNA (cytidine1402-2'-O)-methyltransferase|nr:16S rRNA (cytidine(1402)-2'-O)-methyltransferase [Synergistaceae bacterium]
MPLVVVPTPVGNLEDMTQRGLRELREADVIACEDTRRTIKLLNHYGIKKPLLSYHRHNERTRTEDLIARIETGERVALVSDAGTPGISDPGCVLIDEVIARGLPVDVLPGANALLPALLLSGLSTRRFAFAGFLDGERKERETKIQELAKLDATLLFYVAPHDLGKDLAFLEGALGDRDAAIVREISKVHQETIRGKLGELRDISNAREIKGEIVLVTAGAPHASGAAIPGTAWMAEAGQMKNEGIFDKDIAKALFESYGIPRNRVKTFLLGLDKMSERHQGNPGGSEDD